MYILRLFSFSLFFYIAHNQLEMRELRTKKIELESALHEIQMRMVEKVQKYQVKKIVIILAYTIIY